MQVERFAVSKSSERGGYIFCSVVEAFFLAGALYSMYDHNWSSAAIMFLIALNFVVYCVILFGTVVVYWVEIDEEGITYKQSKMIKRISKLERIQLEKPRYTEAPGWGGTDLNLFSSHHKLRLNENIDGVDKLIDRIIMVWSVDDPRRKS